MKVNNALVTWDDLATMGLTAKGTPPTGKGIANKAELIAAYYVDEAASPFSTFTLDRCPPYQTIQNTTTTTSTTTAPANFTGTVSYGSDAYNACNNAISSFSMTGNGTTFCNSTVFTSTSWYPVATGNYVLSYGGDTLNVSHTQYTNTVTVYGGGCQVCPAVTTTTTTTCNPAANWVYQYQNCNDCTTRNVERDMNPCSPTYLGYTVDHGAHVGPTPPANTGACDTAQHWVIAFSSYTCLGCDQYYNEIQNNPCAPDYGSLRRSNTIYQSNSAYCGGCCGQSTAATWTLMFGSFTCSGCNKYYNEYDSNPCSPTYNTVRMSGTVAEYNSTYCGGCCGQSTAANWVVVFGQYTCGVCAKYAVEQDMNSCSPTYGQQRTGGVLENPSPYCCPGVLTCYSLSSGTSYYDGCNGTSNWNEVYTVTLKDQYGNPIANSTGSNLTFTFQYDYYDHEDYYGCEGGGTAYRDIVIAPGQSFGQAIFYTHQNQYCCYSSMCDGSCYSEEYNVSLISAPLSSC